MKQIAVVLAALLSLALVAPALAQPFADVPTDHWAYDAIAELAAKGLIEGYPDGAFRGDRAMTRYEMAMVVARLLARIEAIKIPPLPPDLARQKDIAAVTAALKATDKRLTAKLATVQRLVAEFRAELAALGVRVTAVEEELAAIRARLDNVKITGDARMRYNVYPTPTVSGSATNRAPDIRLRTRLTFTGRVAPNIEAVVRVWFANNANSTGVNYDYRLGTNYTYANVSYDIAYVDFRNFLGASLWRAGRQFYTLAGHGPFGTGLLYDPANALATAQIWDNKTSGWNMLPLGQTTPGLSDGLKGDFVFGPLNLTLAVFRENVIGTATGTGTAPMRDNWIARATTGVLLPGWTLGASYYQVQQNPVIPATAVGQAWGGSGWNVDLAGTVIPGVRFYIDYAWWQGVDGPPGTPTRPTANAWRVGTNINFAQIAGVGQWNPNIDLEYHDYGPLQGSCIAAVAGTAPFSPCWPVNTYATTITGQFYPFNMRGWLARLNLTFSPRTRFWVMYESGNTHFPTTNNAFREWTVSLAHDIAPRTTVTLFYFNGSGPTAVGTFPAFSVVNQEQFNFYRVQLTYSW